MEKVLRNLLIWLGILVALVPLGIIASGTAYGEWSVDELQSLIGYVPAGYANLQVCTMLQYRITVPTGRVPSLARAWDTTQRQS